MKAYGPYLGDLLDFQRQVRQQRDALEGVRGARVYFLRFDELDDYCIAIFDELASPEASTPSVALLKHELTAKWALFRHLQSEYRKSLSEDETPYASGYESGY